MGYGPLSSADITAYVKNIEVAATLVAREQDFISSLVLNFDDQLGMGTAKRNRNEYGTATFKQISDNDDLTSETFTPTNPNSLTPGMFADQFYMTDERIQTDVFNVMADATNELGLAAGKKVSKDLMALFSSLTGGTAGSAGGTVSWAVLFKAVSLLQQQNAPGPYFGVLDTGHWYHLGTAVVPAGAQTNGPNLQDRVLENYFLGNFFGVNWFRTNDITAGTAAVSAVFSREALAFDKRRKFRIEEQRDASRGGGGWELNASLNYAAGVWRPKFGVQIVGTDVIP